VVCGFNWRSTFSSGNSFGKCNNLLCKPDIIWLRKQYRLAVAVTISNPAAPTGNSTQTFCASDNPTITNLIATGTAIQWYAAATGGTPLAPATALVNATTYYASQTIAGCESNSRLAVAVTINTSPASPSQTTDCTLGSGNAAVTVTSPTGAGIEYSLDGVHIRVV